MIYETNPTPAVKRLLWEIHRLRAAVLRANDLLRALDYYKVKLDPQSALAVTGLRGGSAGRACGEGRRGAEVERVRVAGTTLRSAFDLRPLLRWLTAT